MNFNYKKDCVAAYPHVVNVAWQGHPPPLAKADYRAIDKFLGGFLVSRCGQKQSASAELVTSSSNTAILMAKAGALNSIIFLNLDSNKDIIEHQMKCCYRYM